MKGTERVHEKGKKEYRGDWRFNREIVHLVKSDKT